MKKWPDNLPIMDRKCFCFCFVTVQINFDMFLPHVSQNKQIRFVCLFGKLCICVVKANFGPWNLGPQHGFARNSPWVVDSPATKVCIMCFSCFSLRCVDYLSTLVACRT